MDDNFNNHQSQLDQVRAVVAGAIITMVINITINNNIIIDMNSFSFHSFIMLLIGVSDSIELLRKNVQMETKRLSARQKRQVAGRNCNIIKNYIKVSLVFGTLGFPVFTQY